MGLVGLYQALSSNVRPMITLSVAEQADLFVASVWSLDKIV